MQDTAAGNVCWAFYIEKSVAATSAPKSATVECTVFALPLGWPGVGVGVGTVEVPLMPEVAFCACAETAKKAASRRNKTNADGERRAVMAADVDMSVVF